MRGLVVLVTLAACDRVFGLGDPYLDAPPAHDVAPGGDTGLDGSGSGSGSGSAGPALIAWYKLDGDFTDSVGGADGQCARTAGGSCGFATGHNASSGSAASFPGDACVTVPSLPAHPTEVTISLWLTTGSGATSVLVSRPLTSGAPSPHSWLVEEDFDSILWETVQGASGSTQVATPGIQTVDWHHLAVTASSSQKVVYLDGIVLGTVPAAGTSYASDAVSFGCDPGAGSAARFNGQLDDIKIFDGALTAEQVGALLAQ